MKKIVSIHNETVKHIVKLQAKSYRHKHQQFIAQGFSVCNTLLQQSYLPVAFYVTEQVLQKAQPIIEGNIATIVSDAVMNKISTATTPSGIVGIFQIPKASYTPSNNAIVLHNIQDPGNMGTLIRTAAAMNIGNIFLIDGVDPYSPKVIQATAGTIGYANIIPTSWKNFIQQHTNFQTCALVVDKGSKPEQLNISNVIIVIGNEGQGLPADIINSSNHKMTIPMPGQTESLNAAVAGSIAMYLKAQ